MSVTNDLIESKREAERAAVSTPGIKPIQDVLVALGWAIVVSVVIIFLFGCASAPMTYEQRVALMGLANGLREGGAALRQNTVYVQPPFYLPSQPNFQPAQIDTAFHPAPLIP